MGTIQHHSVLATTWDDKRVEALKQWADANESEPSFGGPGAWRDRLLIGPATTNGYVTVVLVPDGSKEWWDTSDAGDRLRAELIARLKDDDYEDGSSPWDVVEVTFGELGTNIVTGNCLEPA